MNCPYCNEEMKKGFIPANKVCVSWIPEARSKTFLRYKPEKVGGVKLSDNPHIRSKAADAYNCPKCRKVIIEY